MRGDPVEARIGCLRLTLCTGFMCSICAWQEVVVLGGHWEVMNAQQCAWSTIILSN